jgi:hypothetical protein
MRERIYRLILLLLGVAAAIFPVLFAGQLQNHALPFVAVAIGLISAAIWWQQDFDSREAKRIERISNRLKFQEGRSATLRVMIEILTDPILLIEQEHSWTDEEKREGVQKLNSAITQILKALSKEIGVYFDEVTDGSLNTNLMIAYRTADCSPEILRRLQSSMMFMGYRRELDSYMYALELILWGREETDIPPLVLPVEDPKEEIGKRKLLPGAPAAFALNQDRFIPDTHNIEEYMRSDQDGIGTDLERDVRDRVASYFKSKRFRSFASLVLRDTRNEKPIGVLNIQSDRVDRFKSGDADLETLIRSLEHYRFCLQYLLSGQRKLRGIAS